MPVDTTKTNFVRDLFDQAISGYGRVRMADIEKKKRERASQIINENMMSALSPKTVTQTTPDLTRPESFVGPGKPTSTGQEAFGEQTQTYSVPPNANDVFSAYMKTKAALMPYGPEAGQELDRTVGMWSKMQPRTDQSVTLEDDLRAGRISKQDYLDLKHGVKKKEEPKSELLRTENEVVNGVTKKVDVYGYMEGDKEHVREKKYQDFTPTASATNAGNKETAAIKKRIAEITRTNQKLGEQMRKNSGNTAIDSKDAAPDSPEVKALQLVNDGLAQQIKDNEALLEDLNAQIGGTFKAGQSASQTPAATSQNTGKETTPEDWKKAIDVLVKKGYAPEKAEQFLISRGHKKPQGI